MNNQAGPDGGGLAHASFIDALTGQPKSFINMNGVDFWLGELSDAGAGWVFDAWDGFQYYERKQDADSISRAVIAVRSGDVAAVPVPAAAWLMAGGLASLVGIRRRRFNNG